MYDRDFPVVALQALDVVEQLQRAAWIIHADDHVDRTFDCLCDDGLARFKKTRAQNGWNDDSEIEHEAALRISGHAKVDLMLARISIARIAR
jgi:hypothetical protein